MPPESADVGRVGEGSVKFALALNLCSVLARLLSLIVEDCGIELKSLSSDAIPVDSEAPSLLFVGSSVLGVIKKMYSLPRIQGLFPHKLLLATLKRLDASFLQSMALQDIARVCCRRLLNPDVWGEEQSSGGLHEVFDHMSEVFFFVAAESPGVATVLPPVVIGESDRLRVLHVLVATLPVALSVALLPPSPSSAAAARELDKFDLLLQDVLFACAGRGEDLAASLLSSILLFLGATGPSSPLEIEILAIQEHLLCSLHPSKQTESESFVLQHEELQSIFLRRISTFTFLSFFLANVIVPTLAGEAGVSGQEGGGGGPCVEESASLGLLCRILEQLHVTLLKSNYICVMNNEEKDLVPFVVFHLQLLAWKLFDDSPTDTRLRTALKSFLLTLKVGESYGFDV
jgi:hypothetical protein